jgi:hypothetical protein
MSVSSASNVAASTLMVPVVLAAGHVWPVLFDASGADDDRRGAAADGLAHVHEGQLLGPQALAGGDGAGRVGREALLTGGGRDCVRQCQPSAKEHATRI